MSARKGCRQNDRRRYLQQSSKHVRLKCNGSCWQGKKQNGQCESQECQKYHSSCVLYLTSAKFGRQKAPGNVGSALILHSRRAWFSTVSVFSVYMKSSLERLESFMLIHACSALQHVNLVHRLEGKPTFMCSLWLLSEVSIRVVKPCALRQMLPLNRGCVGGTPDMTDVQQACACLWLVSLLVSPMWFSPTTFTRIKHGIISIIALCQKFQSITALCGVESKQHAVRRANIKQRPWSLWSLEYKKWSLIITFFITNLQKKRAGMISAFRETKGFCREFYLGAQYSSLMSVTEHSRLQCESKSRWTWMWSSTPSALRSVWSPLGGRCSLQMVRPLYKCTASIPSSRWANTTFGGRAWCSSLYFKAVASLPALSAACKRLRCEINPRLSESTMRFILHQRNGLSCECALGRKT